MTTGEETQTISEGVAPVGIRSTDWLSESGGPKQAAAKPPQTLFSCVVADPPLEYEPYGDEWRREVMKLPKARLVEILRDECMERRQSKIYGQPPTEVRA